jgi:glucokinase
MSPNGAILADIGGSNARFGWHADGAVAHVRTRAVAQFPNLADAWRDYQSELTGLLGTAPVVDSAALAVATAPVGDAVQFTNSPWNFSRRALQAEMGLATLLVLNDFEALALALPGLRPDQVAAQAGMARRDGPLAVLGPGTGMGVGGVLPSRAGWIALPGEGGHAGLSAHDDAESAVLDHVRRRDGHVSAEHLLAGPGLTTLHAALLAVHGEPEASLPASEILPRGLAGDAACGRTIDMFCALLGSFAGDVALILGARGGVYIGGGIVPRLGERFFASRFRERFESKGKQSAYLRPIPHFVITDTLAALGGAALALRQHAAA